MAVITGVLISSKLGCRFKSWLDGPTRTTEVGGCSIWGSATQRRTARVGGPANATFHISAPQWRRSRGVAKFLGIYIRYQSRGAISACDPAPCGSAAQCPSLSRAVGLAPLLYVRGTIREPQLIKFGLYL